MTYLFETEHFLLRAKKPCDICRCSKSLPDNAFVLADIKQDFSCVKNIPEALIIESRVTGAPVGKVLIKAPDSNPGNARIHCLLYGRFRKDKYGKEIIDMFSLLL